MEKNKVITKVHSEHVLDWYEDSEIKINWINGYDTIYHRFFYEKGLCKRIVIGFTPEERDLASEALQLKKEFDVVKKSFWYKLGKFFGAF